MTARTTRSRQIAQQLAARIGDGSLQAGDRLAAIRTLCRQYRTGQGTVEEAIAALVEQGLVEVRPRSGCYVLPQGDQGAKPAKRGQLLDYLLPRPPGDAAVSLYIAELMPASIAVWRQIVADYPGLPVEIFTCLDGRLEDLMAARPLDVVMTSGQILAALGLDHFVLLDGRELFNEAWRQQLLPQIGERMGDTEPLGGAPFAVTLQYLFVNLDLAEAAGIDPPPPEPLDFLAHAVAARPALAPFDAEPLGFAGIHDYLWMSGAFRWHPESGPAADPVLAERLFAAVAASGLPMLDPLQVVPRFAAGKLLYMVHCSFEVTELLAASRCRWQALPLPLAPQVEAPAFLMAMAISRRCRQPAACLDLVRYLLSFTVQRRFAAMHGNLPALASAVPAVSAGIEACLPPTTVATTLARSTLTWPIVARGQVERTLGMASELQLLLKGQLSPRQAASAFRCYADCFAT